MSSTDQPPVVLAVEGLTKAFPGVRALAGVDLTVRAGEVHALLGANGAGKSTLMRILAGLEQPDAGTIRFRGSPVILEDPHQARQLGVAMIHQELMPFPDLTVAENLLMGREPASRWGGWINRPAVRREAGKLLAQLGLDVGPDRRMGDLGVAEMQAVEIARAIGGEASVIIMDEPTSALSEREVTALFRVIQDLRQRGVAVIYISHRLEEVFQIADTVTVLRDGRNVATMPVKAWSSERLIAAMVGHAPVPPGSRGARTGGAAFVEVRGLGRRADFAEISFQIGAGEIVGLAGLMGAGRTELAEALFGLDPADSGEIRIAGERKMINGPAAALAAGVALVTEDRKRDGLVATLSVERNVTLTGLRACCRAGFIDRLRERETALESIQRFAIKVADPGQPITSLSGGNQQKVVLAKALLRNPRFLILDEPTRGIDVGAKAEVLDWIATLAASGMAVLFISSEFPELLSICDRLLVMREGRLVAEMDPKRATPAAIVTAAMPR